jgi:hypothetical protein
MLAADKAALANKTRLRLLAIRERELALYVQNCRAFGTMSAFMAGIAHSALIYSKMSYFMNSSANTQIVYNFGLTILLCMSLKLVMGTTAITMLGPGLALRGPDGSMHIAVEGIYDEFSFVMRTFNVIVFSLLFLVAFPYTYLSVSPTSIAGVAMTAILIGTALVILQRRWALLRTFPYERLPLVTGAFFRGGIGDTEPDAQPPPPPRPLQSSAQGVPTTYVGARDLASRMWRDMGGAAAAAESVVTFRNEVPSHPRGRAPESSRKGYTQLY